MSPNDDSENDIWDYKPLKKKKKQESPAFSHKTVARRRCKAKGANKGHSSPSSPVNKLNITARATQNVPFEPVHVSIKEESAQINTQNPASGNIFDNTNEDGESAGVHCPVCQMPFSILVGQSQRWHVVDCLDLCRESCKECPDGLLCASIFPNHYIKFNHTLLAQSRDGGDVVLPQTMREAEKIPGHHSSPVNNHVDQANNSSLKTSQNIFHIRSLPCSPINNDHTKSPNGLLLLRSPTTQDLKKKKGWSSPKVPKSVSSGQETKTYTLSTPVKSLRNSQACNSIQSTPSPPEINDAISYSPLSKLSPEVQVSQARKTLFNFDLGARENDNSIVAFSDSEDDLFAEFVNNLDKEEKNVSLNTQVVSVSSSQQSNSNQETLNKATSKCEKEKPGSSTAVGSSENNIQSPQSIVLERLRDTISNSQNPVCESGGIQPHKTNSGMPLSDKMTSQKIQSKGAEIGGLKQTDLGVFFGLKPLKETKSLAQESQPSSTLVEKKEVKPPKRWRQRSSQASTSAAGSSHGTVENGAQGGTKTAGAKGWRRRTTEDGRKTSCPFYKKIPGTKFVVDAFRYGPVEGITTYFLTHFHSDHYDGLNKNSTLPIYCNKITGNLVKCKLKVPEQYVNILPMNTEVTVEGVRVILLDANHCPGAAMLLFFLPDGQTVLHTGDFRADSSMESYPELLSSRVQTLYLDTTYCSPEYTFPKQQEVINFAANTAFELVTLNPRTLVVCGSYSVGKEKVFLALADVLGSKVCLSRDKFNTMCCLESEEIKQRITTDWKSAQVHVLPMMQLSFTKLQDHLARFPAKYDKLVAFKPTGWTFSQQVEAVEDIEPHVNGNVSIYGIPYSEHSSFLEMKRFVQWLKPLKIIPTVNNGRWETRKAMEKCFSEWLKETSRAKL